MAKEGSGISTATVARLAGVHRDTLLRWLREKLVPEPGRDRRGWRVFTQAEAAEIVRFATAETSPRSPMTDSVGIGPEEVGRLKRIDWDFADAKTSYLTHGLHPYPAKYIPQIPNALIQELSVVGDTVGDVFCGSGTTLVEAVLLKRQAVGVDANPLACMIARAKTTYLDEVELTTLRSLAARSDSQAQSLSLGGDASLFAHTTFRSAAARPEGEDLDFWFDASVIEELAEIRAWCLGVESDAARSVALVAFSAIVVAVSKQDSDTRYVRRDKRLRSGDVFRRFGRAVRDSAQGLAEFADICEPRFRTKVIQADVLSSPDIGPLDLVVCSPPYPNAYSYHLYHRTRMLWLGMDQPRFKKEEIGSHRKYSGKGKNAANEETFRGEMATVFGWLHRYLKRDRYACFVVGNSTLAGRTVNNGDLLAEVATKCGFVEVARIPRNLKATAKAFNPAIGRITTEEILVLCNKGNP